MDEIPLEERSALMQIMTILDDTFDGDDTKMVAWIIEKNPFLGDVGPWEMIISGRCERLLILMKGMREG